MGRHSDGDIHRAECRRRIRTHRAAQLKSRLMEWPLSLSFWSAPNNQLAVSFSSFRRHSVDSITGIDEERTWKSQFIALSTRRRRQKSSTGVGPKRRRPDGAEPNDCSRSEGILPGRDSTLLFIALRFHKNDCFDLISVTPLQISRPVSNKQLASALGLI